MKHPLTYIALWFAALLPLLAQTPAPAPGPVLKPATINVQAAILATRDGQKATKDLQNKFMPRRQALERKQSELQALQAKMRTGASTMSQQAKDQLIADIDTRTKAWNSESQDFNDEVQQEQGRVMSDVGQKMLDVIQKYGTEHGILLIADVSNPQSPVLWANASLDITNEVIKLYDQTYPGAPAAAPSVPAPPATKKQ